MRTRVRTALLIAAAPWWAGAASAQTITYQNDTTPFPGVVVRELRTTGPTTRAWATFVDLCSDHVHLHATAAPTSFKTVGTWAQAEGVQLAVNGDFYASGPKVYGDAVGSGVRWPKAKTGLSDDSVSQWYYQKYGWIAFGRDWVEFTHTKQVKNNAAALGSTQGWKATTVSDELPQGTLALVSGFPALVVEGVPHTCATPASTSCFPDRGDMGARHPRTAMGLTEDRRTLILLVVDGRTPLSSGMLGTELAKLMSQLGAWMAFNLDGGGSTELWVQGAGYVNDVVGNNLGNPPRAVANHWGVYAGTAGGKSKKPGHCMDYLAEAVLAQTRHDARRHTDLDGDGRADACIRAASGLRCAKGGSLDQALDLGILPDSAGWSATNQYSTIRMGDLNGDGKADLCARGATGIQCWLSGTAPLATALAGPALSDAGGWGSPAYSSTLRLGDFNGDGRDDLCARASGGFRCYPSTGTGFGAVVQTPHFSDAAGFTEADKYGTLRMGDVDGDGRMDVCGRAAGGVQCYLSNGSGFPTLVSGPAWSDASGWSKIPHWSTLRLEDVNGDGKADLCARASAGFRCHLSTGTAFGPAITLADLSDANGWANPSRYSTLRMADIDGDGALDVCARATGGLRCWKWTGSGFGAAIDGPALTDATGWDADRFYSTLRLADVNGDGRADVCARDGQGLWCWLATATGFSSTRTPGPAWSGANWEHVSVWGTLQLGGPRSAPDAGVPDAGVPDAGVPDAGETDAGETDAGEPDAGEPDAGEADAGEPDAGEPVAGVPDPGAPVAGGCGCLAGGAVGAQWGLLALLALGRCRRRRT